MNRSKWGTVSALGAVLVLWPSAFVGIRAGLQSYPPAEMALLRYLVASAILGGYVAVSKTPLPSRNDWPRVALAGLLGFAAYNLALNAGEQTVTAGSASFVITTIPVLTALLATLFLGERPAVRGWIGILVSLAGTACIAVAEGGGPSVGHGVSLVLLAAILQACYFVLMKPLLAGCSALGLTAAAMWIGTALLLPFLPRLATLLGEAPFEGTAVVLYLGIFPAAIGYVAWSRVLAAMPATRASSFLYVMPVIATGIGWLWLGEMPVPLSLAGGAVALLGVTIVNSPRQVMIAAGRRPCRRQPNGACSTPEKESP